MDTMDHTTRQLKQYDEKLTTSLPPDVKQCDNNVRRLQEGGFDSRS